MLEVYNNFQKLRNSIKKIRFVINIVLAYITAQCYTNLRSFIVNLSNPRFNCYMTDSAVGCEAIPTTDKARIKDDIRIFQVVDVAKVFSMKKVNQCQ